MSATLDRLFKKRAVVVADDEELKNSFFSYIVGMPILAFLEEPIKGKASPRARWLLIRLGLRI